MHEWILIIAIAGGSQIADVQVHHLPAAQCRAVATLLSDPSSNVGAICVGPDGQVEEGVPK